MSARTQMASALGGSRRIDRVLLIAIALASPIIAEACPTGQYRDSFGICWPYGPSNIVPRDTSCLQYTANPVYIQTVAAMNQASGRLAAIGVTNESSCSNAKSAVITAANLPFVQSQVANDLFRCACKDVKFTAAPPPPPVRPATPYPAPGMLPYPAPGGAYTRCFVHPGALPPGTPVTTCDGGGPPGSACGCPRFDGRAPYYPGVLQIVR